MTAAYQQPIHTVGYDDRGNPHMIKDGLDGSYSDLTEERELTYEQYCDLLEAFGPADFEDEPEPIDTHEHYTDWMQ